MWKTAPKFFNAQVLSRFYLLQFFFFPLSLLSFDTHYPEYFPVREGFPDTLAALQARGVRVVPLVIHAMQHPPSPS